MGRKARRKSERRDAHPKRPPVAPRVAAEAGGAEHGTRLSVALVAAVLLLVIATVWGVPRPAVDTFIGLAGGRDAFQGKLGTPDDWSFTTAGRVWLNQNWGFDALMYAAAKAGGEDGLLALKAVMIIAIAGAVVFAARIRGVSWPSLLLAAAAALAGARWYFELRASMATFLLSVLLVAILYWSELRPRVIWLGVPVMVVWVNTHGGFTFGLVLLGLWIAAGGIARFPRGGLTAVLRFLWAPAAVAAASLVAAAFLNPFGVANLTYPLTYVAAPEWRSINEWQPAGFAPARDPSSLWEVAILLATVILVGLWRILRKREAVSPGGRPGTPVQLVLFDSGLFVLMAAMAFSARRFIPLALLVLAPLAAIQVDEVLARVRSWVPIAAALALTVPLVPFTAWVAARYSRDNPRFQHDSVFQRMTVADMMPAAAADFLAENGAEGRVYSAWIWEGALRWRCPRLRLFIGGRATQIYSLETLHAYNDIGSSPRPAELLADWETHLVVVPFEDHWVGLVDRLALSPGSHWAVVFYDGRGMVLADVRAPATSMLAESVAAGRARFPADDVGSLSRTLCRISPAMGGVTFQSAPQLLTANRTFPTVGAPWVLALVAKGQGLPPTWLIGVLEREDAFFAGRHASPFLNLSGLEARVSIAQILANLYQATGNSATANRWGASSVALRSEVETILARF